MVPSGSGKSTLIKLLSAEEKPTKGSLTVNGFELHHIRRSKVPYYRRTLGVVFQDFRLIQSKTVEENLSFAMHVVGIDPFFIRDRVDEVLHTVGLTGLNRRFPQELSGGEQQRVAIARAILNRPKLILADEPTGNLDPVLSVEIMELFEKINQEYGTTVLVVTHEQELVNRMEKRVIHLRDGELAGDQLCGDYHLLVE